MGVPNDKTKDGSKQRAAGVNGVTVFAPGGTIVPAQEVAPTQKRASNAAAPSSKPRSGSALTTGLADVARKTLLGQ